MRTYREPLTLGFAAAMVAIGAFLIPTWEGALFDVCHHAAVAGIITIVVYAVARMLGSRGAMIERVWSAVFLAGMPVVYIVAWIATGGAGTGSARLVLELGGLIAFGGLAWLGIHRSPWFLVFGIAAHGLGWDAWHHAVASGYIPGWYVTACMLADVGIALYLAARIPAWKSAGVMTPVN
jgi:hypothetical protein